MKKLIYLYIFLLIINNFAFGQEINDSEIESSKNDNNFNLLPDIDEYTCNDNEIFDLKNENCQCLEGFQGSDCSDCLNDLNDGSIYVCCNLAKSLEEPKNFHLLNIPKKEERNFLTGVYTIENCLKQNTTIDENEDQLIYLDCNCRITRNNSHLILFDDDNSISNLFTNILLNQNNLFNKRFDNRLINLQDELIIAKAILPCDTFDGTPVFTTGLIVFIIVACFIVLIVLISGIFMCTQLYNFIVTPASSKMMQIQRKKLSEKKMLLRQKLNKK